MPQDLVFDESQVVVTLDGERIEGPGPGSFVVLSPEGDLASSEVGSDGGVVLSVLNDFRGTATISVMRGSRGSSLLDSKRQRMRRKESPYAVELGVMYLPTGEKWVARTAWVQTAPPRDFGAEAHSEEWVLGYARIDGDRREMPL